MPDIIFSALGKFRRYFDARFFCLQVQATDPDCGVNAMVNYTLAASKIASEQLLVRSDTGEICVKSPLDRESASYLELPVIATDRG